MRGTVATNRWIEVGVPVQKTSKRSFRDDPLGTSSLCVMMPVRETVLLLHLWSSPSKVWCGGLNRFGPYRLMSANAWPTGNGTPRRCGLLGGDVSLGWWVLRSPRLKLCPV